MVRMVSVVVAVLVVVVALVAVAAWAVRRRGGDEVHSVDHYRHTLDTLQDIRTRSDASTVRVLGGSDDTGQLPPVGGRTRAADGVEAVSPAATSPRDPGQRLFFDDQGAHGAGHASPARASRRTQDRAITAMNHRPRRLGLPVLVGLVVVGLVAAVVAIGAHDKHPPSTATTTTTAGHRGNASVTTTTGRPGSRRRTTTASTGARSTTTTTATPRTYTPVTSTATTATYTPVDPTYSVTFTTTTGACWLTVRSASGSTLLSQTLAAGQTMTVSASGKTSIIIGAPSVVDVTVDRVPVVLPDGFQTPFYMTLVPATS